MKINVETENAVPEVKIRTKTFSVVPEMRGAAVKSFSIHAANRSTVEPLEQCPHCGLNVSRELMMVGQETGVKLCLECYQKTSQQTPQRKQKRKQQQT